MTQLFGDAAITNNSHTPQNHVHNKLPPSQKKKKNTALRRKNTIIGYVSFFSWQILEVQQSGLDVYTKPLSVRKKSLKNKSKALQSTDQAMNLALVG